MRPAVSACLCLAALFTASHAPAAPKTRLERVKAYTAEFVSQGFKSYPNLSGAIEDVLTRLPDEAFEKVSDRAMPVLFTEYFYTGKARLANSSLISVLPDDPPTFTDGLYVIKLSTELEKHPAAAKAVIAHEIAHHLTRYAQTRQGDDLEKSVNRLVRGWGFGRELQEARKKENGWSGPAVQGLSGSYAMKRGVKARLK